jgi:hypothetical protein
LLQRSGFSDSRWLSLAGFSVSRRREALTPDPSPGGRGEFYSLSLRERGIILSLSLWERVGVRGFIGEWRVASGKNSEWRMANSE